MSIADISIECMDMRSDGIKAKTAEIASRNVKLSNEVEDAKVTSRAQNRSESWMMVTHQL